MHAGDLSQAAALLRRLLDAVRVGNLSVDGPAATAVTRQMQGAAEALELATRDDATDAEN